jgi:hypothetical protein
MIPGDTEIFGPKEFCRNAKTSPLRVLGVIGSKLAKD